MSILNPITDAAVIALDPALEGEHRLQSLLRIWLGHYFTGAPFTTRTAAGGTEQKTFMAVTYLWQEAVMPKNPQAPILHIVFSNLNTQRLDMADQVRGHDDRWMVEVLCMVPANLTATPMKGQDPQNVVRRLAGQVQWLFESTELEALSVHGVMEVQVKRPPAIVMGTGWAMRIMTCSCLTRREQAG